MRKLLLLLLLALAFSAAPQANPAQSSNTAKAYVYICVSRTAHKYHAYECRGLKRCTHDVEKVTKAKAVKLGYTACKICY